MLSKMSTTILSRSMAIIKSAKVSDSLRFNHIKLGAVLSIPTNSAETDEQRMKKYTQVLSQKRAFSILRRISPTEFLQINSELQIISYTKYCIAKNYQSITPQAQSAINNFFDAVYTAITIILSQHYEINKNHILWKDLIEGIKSFNQFYYLKSNNLANCMKFIKSAHLFRPHIQSSIFLLNFRYTLDTLNRIPLNYISQQNIYSIFKCLNKSNIRVLYFNQSLRMLKHFIQPIKNTWHLQMHSRKIIIESMNRLCFYSEPLLNKVQIFFKTKNYHFLEFSHLLNLMLKCKRINSHNFMEYQSVISGLLQSLPASYRKAFFNLTFSNFYMAGVWSPAYWNEFMIFISEDKYGVDFYNLYVLNQTIKIFKDQIPDYILKNLQPMKRIIEQNPDFKGASMITDFTQKQKEQKSLDCQNQLANSLRLMSNRNVITQQLIQFFVVDIIVENKYIIEANGATHYLSDISENKKKFPNLKTQFRSKMLTKLGYYVIDVDLEIYSEGSFQTIQTIFAIVNGNLDHDYQQFGLTVTHPYTAPTNNNTNTDKTI